jgi:ATP synthase F1 gamma subunit
MRRPQEIIKDHTAMSSVARLTTIFESLASMRIAQTKDQVMHSQSFFDELWNMYSQMRVDSLFRFGRQHQEASIDKELFIAITAEGGFSGDIDQKLIKWMLTKYDPNKNDLIIIGHHGAVQLAQAGIAYKKYFKLPQHDQNINVTPLVKEIGMYRNTSVFYQTYVSLMVQDIKRIELQTAVQEAGRKTEANPDIISEESYIFEPDNYAVVAHLERSMLTIALSQVILESKLAQYASRFRSMSASKERATKAEKELLLTYHRAKRATADERLKEMVNGLGRYQTI